MTITTPPAHLMQGATDPLRRTSLAAGILSLLTFVSVLTLALYRDARGDADFVLGAASGVLAAALPPAQALR